MSIQCWSLLRRYVCIPYCAAMVLVSLALQPTAVRAQQRCEALAVPDAYDLVAPSVVTIEGKPNGQGSGVVIDADGVVAVVSNIHVVEGRDGVVAMSDDGAEHEIDGVLAFDDARNLVLLTIKDSDVPLTPVAFGHSEDLEPGDRVIVVSTPDDGLEGTLTTGVVSAMRSGDDEVSGIQMTAAVAPGSSGGGVFDGCGKLVGIVKPAVIASKSETPTQNLNFAIPARDVLEVIEGAEGADSMTLSELMDVLGVSRERVPSDRQQALARFRRGANQGDVYAQRRLGGLYAVGGDLHLAEAWLRRAADQDDGLAQFLLGTVYDALGQQQEAIKWYRRAAEQNELLAQVVLAERYARGVGVGRNDTEAAKWFLRSRTSRLLDEGSLDFSRSILPDKLESSYLEWLAVFLREGRGNIGQDPSAEREIVVHAANEGHSWAQYRMGRIAVTLKNDEEAVGWFRRAFDQRHQAAREALGCMYSLGLGVPRERSVAAAFGLPAGGCGFAQGR